VVVPAVAVAARLGVAVVEGGVLSILNVWLFVTVVVPSRSDAVHVRVVPVVSAVRVFASHPLELAAPVRIQLTVTLLMNQPFAPSVPVITIVTSTSAGSPAALGTETRLVAATMASASFNTRSP
jgi:hypothetical protein